MSAARRIGAVVAGVAVFAALTFALERAGHLAWPPPGGLDMTDRGQVDAWIATLPVAALVAVLAAQAVGALAGTWTAARLAPAGTARRPLAPLIVGVVTLAGTFVNLASFTHPRWFEVASPVVVVVAAFAGARLGRREAGLEEASRG